MHGGINQQWRRHTRACQGKCLGRNRPTSALAAALAVNIGNNEIIYQDILTALVDATNDLRMPCHVQRTGNPNSHEGFQKVHTR